jgi:hypothetical protein
LSPPCVGKENTKKGITKKHVKLQYRGDYMLIKIKGYTKPIKYQLKEHIKYDGMNKDKVNPNGKHQ